MDVGSSPEKKNSSEYQSGALSFEFYYDNEKLITNCGYYQDFKHKLNNPSWADNSSTVINLFVFFKLFLNASWSKGLIVWKYKISAD